MRYSQRRTIKARLPAFTPLKMLRDGRMTGLVKLHRGDHWETERQLWTGSAAQAYA